MELDILTLAFTQSLISVTQAIALFIQYRVNRTYKGIGWWLAGSAFLAVGFIFTSLMAFPPLELLARISNPLIIAGYLFLYIGSIRFLDKKEDTQFLIVFFTVFCLSYYYFMFLHNSITGRTVIASAGISFITSMTGFKLIFNKNRVIAQSANYTAICFLISGVFLGIRGLWTLMAPPILSYATLIHTPIHITAYILPIITSTLWTFGFVIMVNQRLNSENLEEKEQLQMIFNTSPDAASITHLASGEFIDVNAGFLKMSGCTRDEVIGKSTSEDAVWGSAADRQSYLAALQEKGYCENMESTFKRRDGSLFTGLISGKIITINHQPHVYNIVRDNTARKESEQQIQALIHQLEAERNTAQLNSVTDSLTGLANRRYFDDALHAEFQRLNRSKAPLSLIMLDVDHFKMFNDTYGHLAGDECLRQIGMTLKIIVGRAPDIVIRYGGEEFVVVLPETDRPGALILAERIREAVETLEIPHTGSETADHVTVSLGVVTVHTTELSEPEQVVLMADAAMYQAKQQGRNQVVCGTP